MRTVPRRAAIGVIALAVILGITAAAALAVRTVWRTATHVTPSSSCAAGAYRVSTNQAAVASTMVGVVISRGLPERAAVLALAAGLQESKLENLASGQGDRDSVGVLQQRPSQGWGTIAQLMDVHYATGKFLDALIKEPNWQTLPLAAAIQAVQISADGDAYAGHEPEAQALSDALTGTNPAGLSCTFATPTQVASTDQVANQVSTDLPVNQPTTTPQTVTVPGASWGTVAWLVANADRLGIDSVAYAQREWSRTHGWRTSTSAVATAVLATMHH